MATKPNNLKTKLRSAFKRIVGRNSKPVDMQSSEPRRSDNPVGVGSLENLLAIRDKKMKEHIERFGKPPTKGSLAEVEIERLNWKILKKRGEKNPQT